MRTPPVVHELMPQDLKLEVSIVELIGIHEVAYLDHCRQFAWREAA